MKLSDYDKTSRSVNILTMQRVYRLFKCQRYECRCAHIAEFVTYLFTCLLTYLLTFDTYGYCVTAHFRRYTLHGRKSSNSRHLAATDLDDGMISDEYGSDKLRLEPPLSTTGHLDHAHHMHHLQLRAGSPVPNSTDCWRMQTFDYSRVAGETPHATTFDLISSSSAPGGSAGIQPIYCPSTGRYGTSRLGPSSIHASTLSGGSTIIDYLCAGAGDTPLVKQRCGRPHCTVAAAVAASASAAGGGTSSVQMAYETPRFVQNLDHLTAPTTTSSSSSAPTSVTQKAYHDLHDANRQQRRPAVTFTTNPV